MIKQEQKPKSGETQIDLFKIGDQASIAPHNRARLWGFIDWDFICREPCLSTKGTVLNLMEDGMREGGGMWGLAQCNECRRQMLASAGIIMTSKGMEP